ncbi:ribonuclease P protein component [Eubacteriales bacterium OttesenSCG-928-N14]|nr:ribonuclease P protein component [Eubacteriales bacterium OttesenSCG-928-N14]
MGENRRIHAYPKSMRIRRNAEFQYVYRRGKSYDSPLVVLVVVHNKAKSRVGFTCGKKVGNSVKRNRARRLLKESYRLLAPSIKRGCLMVFIGRSPLASASFAQVQQQMLALLQKSGCLKEKQG